MTETVDPLVDVLWKASIPGKTPFGDLRTMFRRHHCRTLNPYGDSENCPYDEKDCARAFYAAVREVVRANDRVKLLAPVGYFLRVAKSSAAKRADEAVGQRAERARIRTSVLPTPPSPSQPNPQDRGLGEASPAGAGAGHGRGSPVGSGDARDGAGEVGRQPDHRVGGEDRGLPGRRNGPVSVGDLFGSLELRSREGRPDDGSKGR